VIRRLRTRAAHVLDRRFASIAGRLDRVEAELKAITPILETLAADDPGHRRRLDAAREDPSYARAWEDPDPLVTILIPTRDRPALLAERSLASALAQTHENIEVIVVGDAAGPEVEAAVASAGDPRARFADLTQRWDRADASQWLTAATLPRNLGYRVARGQWLLDLDDDDALRPDAVERLLAHAREHRVEVAYGVLEAHMPDGSTMMVGGFPPEHTRFGWQGGIVHAGLRFFARELVAADMGLPGDWFRMRRMLRAGVRISHLAEVTCDYFPSKEWGLTQR
jgi:glycosyltransferase involved in cell wall biosynthesis